MKKFIVAILAVFYLASSSGATIHMHYCMGKLVEWSFSFIEKNNDKCSKCGMQKSKSKKGCCKDDVKQLKIEKDQKIAQSFSNLNKVITEVGYSTIPVYSISHPGFSIQEYFRNNAPPRSWNTSLHIINCVFRI